MMHPTSHPSRSTRLSFSARGFGASVTLFALATLAGCGPTWQFRDSAPTLPSPSPLLRSPPRPPAGTFVPDDASAMRAATHGQLPAWAGGALAVTVRGGGEAARAAFDAPFSEAMLRRAGPATMLPSSLDGLSAERRRAETRGHVRDELVVAGDLPTLARIGAPLGTSHVLDVHVAEVRATSRQVSGTYSFTKQEIEAYRSDRAGYDAARDALANQLRACHYYDQSFSAAKAKYEADGGEYGDSQKEQIARSAVNSYLAWSDRYRKLAMLTRATTTLPAATREALLAHATSAKGGTSTVQLTAVRATARLLDSARAVVLWQAGLETIAPSEEAAFATLRAMVLDALLGPAAVAPAAAP